MAKDATKKQEKKVEQPALIAGVRFSKLNEEGKKAVMADMATGKVALQGPDQIVVQLK